MDQVGEWDNGSFLKQKFYVTEEGLPGGSVLAGHSKWTTWNTYTYVCVCVYTCGKKLPNIDCIKLEHSITQRVNSGIIYQHRAIISTHFVSSVSCANNLDECDGHCFEANELPWDATVVAFVDDLDPVALVVGDLYIVAVGTIITVPEEESGDETRGERDGNNY